MDESTIRFACPKCQELAAPDTICPACGTLVTKIAPPLPSARTLPAIPGYEIIKELGHGGMGIVYEARHVGLNRTVALKMIRDSAFPQAVDLARFRAEAEAVARLQHPNIVQVFDIGQHNGLPFFSLEYCPAGSLDKKLRGRPLPPRVAARLVEALAHAMHTAHQAGIVHRDLKPGNILLQVSDSSALVDRPNAGANAPTAIRELASTIPKITDFGLAKKLDTMTAQTQDGSILGTPSYMAPEQATGNIQQIGPATDVYALGVILYELITGRPPFQSAEAVDVIWQVREQEPMPPTRLQSRTPRDLETICLKCLEKEPRKRYVSAAELAEDLRRFQADEPIQAVRPGRLRRLVKWVRRRPAAAALLAVSFLAALTLLVGGLVHDVRLQKALNEASRHRLRLTLANGKQLLEGGDLLGALPWFLQAYLLEKDLPERATMHQLRLAAIMEQCPRLSQVWFHEGGVNDAAFSPQGSYLATAGEDGRAEVWETATGTSVTNEPLRHQDVVFHLAFSPQVDRLRLVTASADKTAMIWDKDSGKVLHLKGHKDAVLWSEFNPQGELVVTASADKTARLWRTSDGRQIAKLQHDAPVRQAAFSPKEKKLLTLTRGETVFLWDVDKGAKTASLQHPGAVQRAVFSPDGQSILTVSTDSTVALWNAATGMQIWARQEHHAEVNDGAFCADGSLIVTGSDDNTARVWNAQTGQPLLYSLKHGSDVYQVSFDLAGRRLLTGGDDNTARVWDVKTGDPLTPPLKHNGTVRRALFSPDGRLVLTASQDGLARLWDIGPVGPRRLTHGSRVLKAAFSADGKRFVTVSDDKSAQVWDAQHMISCSPPLQHKGHVHQAEFSPDGKYVVTASADKTAQVWEISADKKANRLITLKHQGDVRDAAFSPDGQKVVTASVDGNAQLWDKASGKTFFLRHLGPGRKPVAVHKAAFSPDGDWLITAAADRKARVWDLADRSRPAFALNHDGPVLAATFSPNGAYLATASADRTARVWDAKTGEPAAPPLKHASKVYHVSFSPDSRQLVTASDDNTAQVWDRATGRPLTPPLRHNGSVSRALFSPSGTLVLSGSEDNTARLWEAANGELLVPPMIHRGSVLDVAFWPASDVHTSIRVLTASADNTVRMWVFENKALENGDLEGRVHMLAGGRIDQGGVFLPLEWNELRSTWERLKKQ